MGEVERRECERTAVTLIVEYEGAGDLVDDYTTNLSVGGTFVHTERILESGTPVDLLLSFPGLLQPIHLSGVVRWTSRGYEGEANGVGIEFLGYDEVAQARLTSVVNAIIDHDPRVVADVARVLIAENNPHTVQLMCQGLEQGARRRLFDRQLAFEFTVARDAQETIDSLANGDFDVIIVDLNLPMLDGARFVESIRAQGRHRRTPLVVLSDEDGHEDSGIDFSLGKPLKLRMLVDVMKRVLSDAPSAVASGSLPDA